MNPAVQDLIDEADRAARFIRGQTPASLRAWAARLDDFQTNGIKGSCMPADALARAAEAARAAP